MKQYLLSIYQPDGEAPPPERLEPIMRDVAALDREMRTAGAWVFSAGLHPASTATVLRVKDDELLMTDGPFTEGYELLSVYQFFSEFLRSAVQGVGGSGTRRQGPVSGFLAIRELLITPRK
ncbi:hypothetical protein [Streptosporangium sp. NPDC049644]|uniref:YciI family protein n=1 Tax=Streptosporangium sp. NPDC049644 TaxID=3155507 RepID=UPI003428F41D